MKELYIDELSLVSGGNGLRNSMETIAKDGASGTAIGGFLGAAKNAAVAGARWGGSLAAAGSIGFEFGGFIYNNSESVRETSIGMIESLHLRYGDQSGNDYGNTNTTNKDGNAYGG